MGIDTDCNGSACGEAVWSYDFPGPGNQYLTGVATDASGNIYLAGSVGGSMTIGTHTIVSNGASNVNAFVAKFDPSGNFVWGGNYGDGANAQVATGIAVDGSGNVTIAGWFLGSIVFGTKTLTGSTTNPETFVAQFDASGNPSWAFAFGSTSEQQEANGVGVDGSGNVYVTGYFTGTLSFGTTSVTASGTQDLFVVKLNSQGTAVWSVHSGIGGWTAAGNAIAVDATGNAFVAGQLMGAYVERLSSSGMQSWAQSWGNDNTYASAIALDGMENAYVTGTGSLGSPGSTFVMKVDVLGNQKWEIGGNAYGGLAIAADTMGNSYVAGVLDDGLVMTADGGQENTPAFLWKLNPDGTYAWSRTYGMQAGVNHQSCRAAALSGPSFVILGCENSFTMDFGAPTGPVTASGAASLNITLAKIATQ
jgi:hypothetical protein